VAFGTYLREIARSDDERGELAPDEAAQAFGAMLDGGVPELELGAMLIALRMKGESLGELLGCYEALGERVHRLEPLGGTVRTVLIGTYGGTRSQPNLTPLVALVLRRLGVPVLVHGTLESRGCVASAYILRELGVLPCATLAQAQSALDHERIAFVPTAVLSPGLADLLALRNRLGVPSTAHLLAKLIDPFRGASLRLVGAAEPRSLAQTREIRLQCCVVFIVAILFDHSYDSSLGYEAGEIIDVTVGIVAGNAITEPENVGDAEIIAQPLLDLIARKIGISILI